MNPLAQLDRPEIPSYTFATFVGNQPGRARNPLFLHGPTGSGKTHLLHAITHELRASQPPGTVLRMTAEKFAAAIYQAIWRDDLKQLRASVSAFSAVVIDDFSAKPSKPLIQDEMLHCLGRGIDSGTVVVIAFWASRAELKALRRRHEALFSRATIVRTAYPNRTGRRELATRAAVEAGAPHRIAEYLARRLTGSPAEIKAVMARVAAESMIARPVDLARVARICDLVAGPAVSQRLRISRRVRR
jgi:chromosomal replication initiator protein